MEDMAIQTIEAQPTAIERPMNADQLIARRQVVKDIMARVMKDNEHYGKIPGCGDKPALLQPGAQTLMMTFRLAARRKQEVIELSGGHREVRTITELYAPDSTYVGSGVGSCSTMESRYRYRKADLTCPECGKAGAIIKGKAEFGGGWICYGKKGGCGQKWTDADNPFAGVEVGVVEHDNPADYWNTVAKMSAKRADVHATISTLAVSDIFTQDVEDMAANGTLTQAVPEKPKVVQPQRKSQAPPDRDKQKELVDICLQLADAGQMVVSADYKTFGLTDAMETDRMELAKYNCQQLSTFVGKEGTPVQGKLASDLTGTALNMTLHKAHEVMKQLGSRELEPF